LAPFIAAILAVPLLGESLSPSIVVGLVGMGIGALQPWRWFRQDSLTQKIKQQNTQN
ncbi:TPA: EamA/RhaT family transporter, partial [Acinetobacter baumannii]|nr:EamA/RhaT family transporter [Acinetobacter baumannii]HDX5869117.1 EamA/RhaT family transporter [Acinetobacter baumannii]